ncbi:hypothetical protein ACA910_018041 [Epithemia clementina (nom. ined.)]
MDASGVATAGNVNAALSALTQDLEQMSNGGTGDIREHKSIPPHVLIPTILKHLSHSETSDRTVRCCAALLATKALTETAGEYAVYMYQSKAALDHLLSVLERSGSDRKTLYVQEQAARTIFYLTERKTILSVVEKAANLPSTTADNNNKDGYETASSSDDHHGSPQEDIILHLDLLRAVQSMLDHASSTSRKNPNLARWAAACLPNILAEDERRACLAVNDVAALVAVGEPAGALKYESVLPQLIDNGGVMILCSLLSVDDADTRAHAVAALGTALSSTRTVQASRTTLAELTGTALPSSLGGGGDGALVRAILAGGGCADSVASLLLSADHGVARMGCQFLHSLVGPLMTQLAQSNQHNNGFNAVVTSTYNFPSDTTASGACREAALEISTGSCLPALLSLIRGEQRPTELRLVATETLAAVALAIGQMGHAWAGNQYEEGLEGNPNVSGNFKTALSRLNQEGVVDACLDVVQSGSLGSSDSQQQTPSSRMREAAAVALGSLTSCSAEAIMNLQTRPHVLSSLLAATNDVSSTIPSTLRGDAAPRCLGVLDTVAAILLFAWQQQQQQLQQQQSQQQASSAAGSSELLDATIEVLDAGVIPYLSRVLNSKIDWDASNKAVGGMKGKAAACHIVCSLFGIVLSDTTGIGMRRLMDAVDADARNYRKGEKLPQNVMEAALSVLQTSSSKARNSIMGNGGGGEEFQGAVMDLVDAALLAAGSLCGSPAAPNVEGAAAAMVGNSQEDDSPDASYMNGGAAPLPPPPPPDAYANRRLHLCSLATDIVVRGTRQQGPALLPTMLVGGLGEATALSSIRLALAVCQHGSKEQHAKLATSGILVPISDSLRTALSSGDLYKFSASLALVRYCGPHVAAGATESVRNAIRVATNVLTLPLNPHATLDQMERQESLKAECIRALEALSRNASLWSSISSDALPSIVRFLQMSVGSSTTSALDPRRQQTRCAALRSVLQIVQVPSHAVSAAENGLCDALGNLLLDKETGGEGNKKNDEVPMLALEVLHVIAMNAPARRKARCFLDGSLTRSICAALGKSATLKPNKPSDSRADVTFLGLEILCSILLDITPKEAPIEHVLQSAHAKAFLEAVAAEPIFVRACCATLLLKTNMKVPRHDADPDEVGAWEIPSLYGDPLILVQEACGGYDDTHQAAAAVLYTASVFACAIESKYSDAFWSTIWVQDNNKQPQSSDGLRLSATFAAHFLALMTLDYKPLVPTDARRKQEYLTITRPLVRYRLLEWLKDALEEVHENDDEDDDAYMVSVVVSFNVPHTCLSLWKDPALLDLAFDLIQNIVKRQADEVLHLFVESEAALQSLLDWLNLDTSTAATSMETSRSVSDIRRFLASTLGKLAESGLLTRSVERFHVRSSAIQALAAACLAEEERSDQENDDDDDVDMTSNRLSSVLMKCLVELCTVTVRGRKKISLSAAEAESIAQNLGSKICQMVLSRFLERAKLQIYEMEDEDDDEEDSLMNAPDLAMLCAIAQHEAALKIIRSLGGLHALSLVAAEGNVSAMGALKKACETDATVLLEGDAHEVVLKIFSDDAANKSSSLDKKRRQQLEGVAFELLARLCSEASAKGRTAVAASDHCDSCVERAMQILISLSGFEDEGEVEEEDDDEETGDGIFADEDEEENGKAPALTPPRLPPPSAPSALPMAPPSYNELVACAPPAEDEVEDMAPIGESELGVSACLLLSALSPMPSARKLLVENETFAKALSSLAGDTSVAELRYAGLKLVSALLPFVAGEDKDSTDRLSAVLLAALTSEHKLKPTARLNANLLHSTAIAGIVVVFDSLSMEQQEAAGTAIVTHFQKTVRVCTTARSTAKQAQRLHAAELSYQLSMALMLMRGKEFMNRIFTQEVLVSFLNLIQWRMDPKTSTGTGASNSAKADKKSTPELMQQQQLQQQEQEDATYWDAALSNCLLILSLLLWRPDGILKEAQIDLTALASTTLMVARPGKAPRKALDVKAALTKIVENRKEASAALAAQRILNRIF